MGQRVNSVGELNRLGEAKGNRVRKGRQVGIIRPETGLSIHDQGEETVTRFGGPNPLPLQR